MGYTMDMTNEKAPKIKILLPEGWRKFQILNVVEGISKAQNPQFIFSIRDMETGYEEDIYAIMEQGKRWFLKNILTAVGCAAGQDGVYEWDISDVLGKEFMGLVKHEDNEWVDRKAVTHKDKQHKIVDCKAEEEANPGWVEEKQ